MPHTTYENMWLKRVLIPFWVAELAILMVYIAFLGVSVAFWQSYADADSLNPYVKGDYLTQEQVDAITPAFYAVAGVLIALSAMSFIFDIVEIVLLARKRLNPVVLVILNCITTLVWLVLFIISIIGSTYGTSGFLLPILLLASYVGKLIYGSVVLHRFRKGRYATRGTYTPAQVESQYQPYTSYNPTLGNPVVHPPISRDPSPGVSTSEHYVPKTDSDPQKYYDPAHGGRSFEMQERTERR